MPTIGLALTKDSELVQQAIYFIRRSHDLKIPPKMIMTCAAEDEACNYPTCFIYGAESFDINEIITDIALTPFVTPWQVGAWLIQHDWAYNETETRRFGVRVKWYELAVHVLMR